MLYSASGKLGIRYCPVSFVTTIFAYFVGRSMVSAITQTPASGPFVPVTTPPMSSSSTATAVWALKRAGAAASKAARPIAATVKHSLALSLMGALLVRVVFCRARLCRPLGPRVLAHAPRARAKILHSPCRPAISPAAAALPADDVEIAAAPRERRASPGVGPRCERRALRPASAVWKHMNRRSHHP